jgi:hypothetical protein
MAADWQTGSNETRDDADLKARAFYRYEGF